MIEGRVQLQPAQATAPATAYSSVQPVHTVRCASTAHGLPLEFEMHLQMPGPTYTAHRPAWSAVHSWLEIPTAGVSAVIPL